MHKSKEVVAIEALQHAWRGYSGEKQNHKMDHSKHIKNNRRGSRQKRKH